MRTALIVMLCLVAGAASADVTYRWVDKEGRVHYTDLPPAPKEAAKVERKPGEALKADSASYQMQQAMTDYPVVLYTAPDCAACQQGKELLARRGIPYTEKTVSTLEDIEALKTLRGDGQALVPVLQIGRQVLKSYLATQWESLLDAAGYPKAKVSGGATPSSAGQ